MSFSIIKEDQMFRKILAIVAISAIVAFAQDDTYVTEVPNGNQNAAPATDDKTWAINIHPITLTIFTALNMPMIYLTVERTLGEKTSLVVRPVFAYISSEAVDTDSDDPSFTISAFGASAGVRYYTNPMHRGLYIDGLLSYAHASLEYDEKNTEVSAYSNGFGPYVYVGWKYVSGSVTFSFDGGFGFNIVSASAEGRASAEDDLEKVSLAQSGFGYDIDIMFGFAF